MPFVILPTNSASGGYDITNSLRFNSGSSDYLNRTPATTTNQKTWTYSFWIKRSNLGTTQYFLYARNNDDNRSYFRFTSSDTLGFFATSSASVKLEGSITSRVFRDVSAWYHIVLSADTTQATSTNRFRIYVNGTEQTLTFDTTPSQNSDLSMNIAHPTAIGVYADGLSGYLNGYMSEIYMIDGSQLTPSSFGETDFDTGIWKPKAYTGTYGTNGFYLQFKNSASLGTDSSGNGNTFTVNNLTSIDQTTDTPTNNFATLNPLSIGSRITLTQGNLQQSTATSTSQSCRTYSTIAMSSGKWFCEYKVLSGIWNMIGIATVTDAPNVGFLGNTSGSYSYYQGNGTPYKYNNGSGSSYGASFTTNDIIGIAFDADNGTLTFYKNGSSQGTAFTGIASGTYYFAEGDSSNDTWSGAFNFGNPPYTGGSYTDGAGYGNFSYAVPSGYYSLNTKNLATFG
jgi:hypothetical protein